MSTAAGSFSWDDRRKQPSRIPNPTPTVGRQCLRAENLRVANFRLFFSVVVSLVPNFRRHLRTS